MSSGLFSPDFMRVVTLVGVLSLMVIAGLVLLPLLSKFVIWLDILTREDD